ncbi:MAG TPA: hypothetical protein VMS22_23955, partial [Candidatus Eisenbacteria bacterium]|nr:hypothetical protein [Candidatus Eisenbacteria bacterium]
MPLPQVPCVVVVVELVVELDVLDEVLEDVVGVVVDDVLELVVVEDEVLVVVVDSHWHWELQTWPSGHRSAPDGELGSHCSPESTTPLPQVPCVVLVDDEVVVVLDVLLELVVEDEVLVVVVDSHWHWELQTWPSGHRSAPDGELG